jgi:hypothetical protein
MVDSGAIGNYISPGYVKRCHIEICDKEKLYKLALANRSPAGQTGWMNTKTVLITLNI